MGAGGALGKETTFALGGLGGQHQLLALSQGAIAMEQGQKAPAFWCDAKQKGLALFRLQHLALLERE